MNIKNKSKYADRLLSDAFRKCEESFGDKLLSSTSTRKFDPLRTAFADIAGLRDDKAEVYVVSAGNRIGNLQVRLKQGNRAGAHTPLGVGVFEADQLHPKKSIQNLFESIKENVAKGESTYDVVLAVAAKGGSCEVEGIFIFSKAELGENLRKAFPRATVFEEICISDTRPASVVNSYEPDPELFEQAGSLLDEHKNIVLEGPPGSGKTEFARMLATEVATNPDQGVVSLQFHPAYAYEEFMLGWRPSDSGGWERKLGLFPILCKQATDNRDERYVLILDELNRAEITAVFGEAFTLIDASKRSSDWAMPMQGSQEPEHILSVPENVYIIGTINTADRTAHSLDYALRRRFAFLYIAPDFGESVREKMSERGLPDNLIDEIFERLTKLNAVIEAREFMLGRGFEIAQGYAIPNDIVDNPESWWSENVNHRILPVLRSYFFDDVETLATATDILEK